MEQPFKDLALTLLKNPLVTFESNAIFKLDTTPTDLNLSDAEYCTYTLILGSLRMEIHHHQVCLRTGDATQTYKCRESHMGLRKQLEFRAYEINRDLFEGFRVNMLNALKDAERMS